MHVERAADNGMCIYCLWVNNFFFFFFLFLFVLYFFWVTIHFTNAVLMESFELSKKRKAQNFHSLVRYG